MKRKIDMKNILTFMKRYRNEVAIATVSLLTFIIGIFAVGFLKSFLIVGFLVFLLFGLPLIKNKIDEKQARTKVIEINVISEKRSDGMSRTAKKKNKAVKKGKKIELDKNGKPKKQKHWFKTTLKVLLILFFVGVVSVVIFASLFLLSIIKDAPKFDPKNLYKQESTILYDDEGKIFARLGIENREKISYDELPEVLINAIISTEDANFFQHKGVDLTRFMVASFKQIILRDTSAGGGSTLTMQVSKNAFTSTEATGIEGIKRKFTDIYVAMFQIEKKYSKKEIMEFYVNSYFMGAGAYGVEQAAQTYFGKSVKDITLSEAALIAGLFQAPNSYNPFLYPEKTRTRMNTVLKLMVRHGYITEEERKIAAAVDIEDLVSQGQRNNAGVNEYQGFIDTVVDEIRRDTGNDPYRVPMQIYTTMNRKVQDHINGIMYGKTYSWENDIVQAGIAVTVPSTGAIAGVGTGRSRQGEGELNRAASPKIKQHIGSTAKPLYGYGPSIEFNGASSYTPYFDEEYSYTNGPRVYNWDNQHWGWMTSRYALGVSRNIPALKAFQSVNQKNVETFVKNLGLHPEEYLHESHAIGGYNGENPLSMASAYAAFANGGVHVTAHSYTKIIYRDTGEVYEKEIKETRAMSEETAYIVWDMLVTTVPNALFGYAPNANGIKYGAKTGTSNWPEETIRQYGWWGDVAKDLWVIGTTDQYAIGVWYGYDKAIKDYVNRVGGNQHMRIFQAVANGIFTKQPEIKKPAGVLEVTIENYNATPMLPSEFTPAGSKITELFVKGTEPTMVSTRYERLKNVTGLKGTAANGKVTLNWTAIATPDILNRSKLADSFNGMVRDKGMLDWFINNRILNTVGSLVYDVYEQRGSNLVLVGSTSKTTLDVSISSNAVPITYIVKSAYTAMKTNQSTGASVTVDVTGQASVINISLNGSENETIKVNSSFSITDKGPRVTENGINKTSSATINTTIRQSGTTRTLDYMINNIGTYTITYNVSYGGTSKTLTQTVNVTA